MNTVERTVNENLCISCGICKAICPANCISYKKEKGIKVPVIDVAKCINCGKCYQVCPGKGFNYARYQNLDANDKQIRQDSFWVGNYYGVYTAWTLDHKRRENAVSGGIVTELVYNLLEDGEYESAFLVGTHEYPEGQAGTEQFVKGQSLEDSQKSRYLPVLQEKAVSYMISNREKKLILVGTGCFVEGIMNTIETYRLDRKNYFIIGLFCDRTMTGNIVRYFSQHPSLSGNHMKRLFFRTKEAGGWPGGVKMETEEGKDVTLSNVERMMVKDYLQPERCLYCLDKLNMFADISVGDNYTKEHSGTEGSSSVILRTEESVRIWEKYTSRFAVVVSSMEQVKASQHLNKRKDNFYYARLKERSIGRPINTTGDLLVETKIPFKLRVYYWIRYWKVCIGAKYEEFPWALSFCLLWKKLKLMLKRYGKEVLYVCKSSDNRSKF